MSITEVLVRIVLPFWLDFPNLYRVSYDFLSFQFDIVTRQDLWKIDGRGGNNELLSAIVPETMVIDPRSLRIREKMPELTKFGFSEQSTTEFIPIKQDTCFEIEFSPGTIPNDEVFKEIWDQIQIEIDRLLSLHAYMKLNSDFPPPHSLFLHSAYYTKANTFIYKVSDNKLEWIYPKFYLELPAGYNFPITEFTGEALEFIKSRYSTKRRKLRTREHIISRMKLAGLEKDANSIILYTSAYLEMQIKEVLGRFHQLRPELLDHLFKTKGLSYFVKVQLPIFFPNLNDLIEQAIILVQKRNEILHLGSVYEWDTDIQGIIEKTTELISNIENRQENRKFSHKKRIAAVLEEKCNDNWVIRTLDSRIQAEFEERHPTRFSEYIWDQIRENFPGFNEKKMEIELGSDHLRVLEKESTREFLVFYWPFPTYFEHNRSIFIELEKIIDSLSSEHKPRKIRIKQTFQSLPPNTREFLAQLRLDFFKKYKDAPYIEFEDLQIISIGSDNLLVEVGNVFFVEEKDVLSASFLVEKLQSLFPWLEVYHLVCLYPEIILWDTLKSPKECALSDFFWETFQNFKDQKKND